MENGKCKAVPLLYNFRLPFAAFRLPTSDIRFLFTPSFSGFLVVWFSGCPAFR